MNIDLTKPVRDKHTHERLHYIGIDAEGRHVFDPLDRTNRTWTINLRVPPERLEAVLENIPEPPPKTFDLKKALRMGWCETDDGRQWHALHRHPLLDRICCYDANGYHCFFSLEGKNMPYSSRIQLVNSHLDEPPPPTVLWLSVYRGDKKRWVPGGSFYASEAEAKENSPFCRGTVAVTFPAELTGANP